MADFSDIRAGLKKVLNDTIQGLTVYEYWPDSPTYEYPCLIIDSFGDVPFLPILQAGGFQAPLFCYIRVRAMSSEAANKELEQYRWPNGANSIFATVNTDHTLNGKVDHAYLQSTGRPERDPDNEDRAWEWQSEFILEITHSVN